MNPKHQTREAWLEAAIEQMEPLFKQGGYEIPDVRVACGWPVRGGLGKKKRVLGECWSVEASEDKKAPQVFISPWLSGDMTDPMGVLPTLVHEIVHAVVGHKENHNKVFGKCARSVGLEGKLTATVAGETLLATCKQWADALGEYPHSQLNGLKEPGKKQSTRLLKCQCKADAEEDICGYTVRITQKWLDEVGPPHCPVHGGMEVDKPKDTDEGEE